MTPHQRRRLRLARQLVIHGKRFAGTDEDFEGGMRRPITMTEAKAAEIYNWAIATPNRWRCTARAYFVAEDGSQYVEEVESETGQACLANELSEARRALLGDAVSSGNPRHLVAESFELRVI